MDPEIRNTMLHEVDRDICVYVREMQAHAPVTAEAILLFLSRTRGRRVDSDTVQDRLSHLTDLGDLRRVCEWQDGELVRFEITAQGRDRLDGVITPANWRPH
jgi:hypothetical protein